MVVVGTLAAAPIRKTKANGSCPLPSWSLRAKAVDSEVAIKSMRGRYRGLGMGPLRVHKVVPAGDATTAAWQQRKKKKKKSTENGITSVAHWQVSRNAGRLVEAAWHQLNTHRKLFIAQLMHLAWPFQWQTTPLADRGQNSKATTALW